MNVGQMNVGQMIVGLMIVGQMTQTHLLSKIFFLFNQISYTFKCVIVLRIIKLLALKPVQ
jgi:hypothetical protein